MPRYLDGNPPDDYAPPFNDALYEELARTNAAEDLEPLDHGEADHGAPDRPPPMLADDEDEDLDPVPANAPGPTKPVAPSPKRAPRVDRPLLVTTSGHWYIQTGSGYKRVSKDGLLIANMRIYHPHLKVTVPGVGDGPPRPMGPGRLLEEYGRIVDRVIYGYTIDGPRFDPEPADPMRGTLQLQAGRRTPVRPVRHPEVEAWIKLLAGRRGIGRLLDWLATLHLLDRPTAALLLCGPPSAGKGLLASGIAAMFGGERVTLAAATSRFNASLLKSPIVHLDEGAEGGRTSSARLRELIGESSHEVEPKYEPCATLKGCPRVIVTTNNPDALKIAEDLTAEDEAAIGVRFLLIDVPTDPDDRTRCPATEYLAEHGGREHFTRDWVERDGADGKKEPGKLCEHIAWLQAHRVVTPGPRFLVEGDPDAWRRRAGERGGIAAQILSVLAKIASGEVEDAEHGRDRRQVVMHRTAGEAWVSASEIQRRWPDLTKNRAAPHQNDVSGALGKLSIDGKGVERRANGRRLPRLYRIPADAVLTYAERHGIGEDDRIRRWFGIVGDAGRAEGGR